MDDNEEFDKAGREIFRVLGLDPDTCAPFEVDSVNVVYRGRAGGALYIGDQRVAKWVVIMTADHFHLNI